MEYVDGRDLRSLLRKVREHKLPMPEPVAASVVMKMANALDYAHRKRGINDRELKLVHRDISPQNILISFEGAVKLVDFGIAKAATKSTQTMAGALKGKLLYMSPEQALGQHLDGRSDLYSLGLVLFELLTGVRCFQADSELGVLEKVRLGKVQDARAINPGISPEMAAILDKALQKDVDRRYASARLLERDLKALLVKRGDEPTEHDLSDYVNTLLKGTRDELEALVDLRYRAPGPAAPAEPFPAPEPEAPLAPPSLAEGEPPPDSALVRSGRPSWLLPVLGALGGLTALGVWLLRK
jgi:serine/threonine protein kinase